MLEIARITHNGETYTVNRAGVDYIFDCTQRPGQRYRDSFAIPAALLGWLRGVLPDEAPAQVTPWRKIVPGAVREGAQP